MLPGLRQSSSYCSPSLLCMVLFLHHLKELQLSLYSNLVKNSPCNYRPISMTYTIIKVFEQIVRKQVVAFLTRRGHMNNTQHSFRSGRSCRSALLGVFDDRMHMLSSDCTVDMIYLAPNDTAYTRWSCHSKLKLPCKLCRTFPPQQWGLDLPVFLACRPCGPAGWLALLLTKASCRDQSDTLNKQVWICDFCHKQIHVRKQISIRCNRIEHCLHLRCAGIHQAQHTYTWTCHLYI